MSTVKRPAEELDTTDYAAASVIPVAQRIEASAATLGEGMRIMRAMPSRHRHRSRSA